jgi:hypothetical protein
MALVVATAACPMVTPAMTARMGAAALFMG